MMNLRNSIVVIFIAGHWSIIQILSRKGIYIMEADETAVTETNLMKTAPFRMVSN